MPEFLRISATVQTPVVTDGFLSLEGVLWREILRREFGFEIANQPNKLDFPEIILPFETEKTLVRRKSYSFYKCSLARWNGTIAKHWTFYTKTFPLNHQEIIDRKGKRGSILIAGGPFKSKNMPVFTICAREIVWYAVGDKSEIEKLLPFITGLGKYTVQGFGMVESWDITEIENDWSLFSPLGLMRAIPSRKGTFFAYRAPGWALANQTICQIPDSIAMTPDYLQIDFYDEIDKLQTT